MQRWTVTMAMAMAMRRARPRPVGLWGRLGDRDRGRDPHHDHRTPDDHHHPPDRPGRVPGPPPRHRRPGPVPRGHRRRPVLQLHVRHRHHRRAHHRRGHRLLPDRRRRPLDAGHGRSARRRPVRRPPRGPARRPDRPVAARLLRPGGPGAGGRTDRRRGGRPGRRGAAARRRAPGARGAAEGARGPGDLDHGAAGAGALTPPHRRLSRAGPGRSAPRGPRTRGTGRRTTRAVPHRCACGSSPPGPARRCRTPGCASCRGPARRGTRG